MRLLKEPSICPSGHLCLLQWYQLQSACFYCACLCGCMYTFTQFHCLFLGLLFPSSSSTGSSPLSFSCSCVFLVGSLVNMLVCVCARKAQRCLWPLFAWHWWPLYPHDGVAQRLLSLQSQKQPLFLFRFAFSSASSLFSHTLHPGWWMESGCEMGSESTRPHARGPWHPFKQHMTSGGNGQT